MAYAGYGGAVYGASPMMYGYGGYAGYGGYPGY